MAEIVKKLELMAPAGDLDCALAAFAAGADSVYAGLGDFNARQRAGNFTPGELAALTAWARRNGRQVYIAFNTLLKDTERASVGDALEAIDTICPHAVIVQDLGAIRILREFFPHLKIHASTQVGAHNSAGVTMLGRLGADRVILERQVTLDELALIRIRTSLDLEVFVHGALCCCLSGMCLFSSWMGGWSGNRGRCKQPCRRRFFTPEGNGFFFSTQDLYSLDTLPRLAEMGINAVKIEGRLREPAYVSHVVTAYRLVRDAPVEDRPAALKEARGLLGRTGGRKWSPGFRTTRDFDTVIEPSRPGGSGKLCGKVDKIASNGFVLRPQCRITIGDTLRVQPPSGEAGPALTVTMISDIRGDKISALRKSQRGLIHCDKDVVSGSSVYLTARKTKLPTVTSSDLDAVTKTLALQVRVATGGVTVEILNIPCPLSWCEALTIPEARQAVLSPQKVAREFVKVRCGTWRAVAVRVDIDGSLFIQDKQLRQVRQKFSQWLEQQGICCETNRVSPGRERLDVAWTQDETDIACTDIREETVCCVNGHARDNSKAICAVPIEGDIAGVDEVILPAFCSEHRLSELSDKITGALTSGVKRLRVTSLYQFELLGKLPASRSLCWVTGFPLPACNRFAVDELRALGSRKVLLWPELEREVLEALVVRYGYDVEIFASGRLPILVTRAHIPVSGRITGGHGQEFHVENQGGLTTLYPAIRFAIPALPGGSVFHDRTGPPAKQTSDFNFQRQWL
ncbi:peptidase U32 family protein [Planctomycetota bacterium]